MSDRVFVARQRELSQLQRFLDRALAGQGQVAFVTGEAGSGKTALVTEFARRAQDAHPDVLVAIGNCNAQTGLGDPYLPFQHNIHSLIRIAFPKQGLILLEPPGSCKAIKVP